MSESQDEAREMQAICRMITWFDGYANLSCVDPVRIERTAKLCGEDVRGVFSRVRGDIQTIARLPAGSRRVVRLGKMVNTSRFLLLGFILLAVVFWLLASQFAPKLLSAPGTSLAVLGIIAVVFNSDLVVYMYSTRKLSKEVRDYFRSHGDEAKFQRRRVKEATQALIDKLATRVRSSGAEPKKYTFTVLDQGYANIRASRGEGLYTATVRL